MRAASGIQLELALPPAAGEVAADPGSSDRSARAGDGSIDSQRRRISGLLSVLLPQPVDVVFTNNASTMLSYKQRLGRLELRLHRMFRHADDSVVGVLARFVIARDRESSNALDRFIDRHRDEIKRPGKRRPSRLRTAGRHQDLQSVLDTVCGEYFGGEIDVRICWGRVSKRRRRRRSRTRSRALATYSFDSRTIRVSPVLDSPDVPSYVLEWIVYHELLHHVLPVERDGGRSRYHTNRFKALERAFAEYEEAKAWEEENLEWLLR
jgi:hypothetical protein